MAKVSIFKHLHFFSLTDYLAFSLNPLSHTSGVSILSNSSSFLPGSANDEGKSCGYRGELCCTRPEDEEAFKINGGRVWIGPEECRTWTIWS